MLFHMKLSLTTLVIASFVGIAVFGVFGMIHMSHGHGGCIAATARGVDCPSDANPFDVAASHLDAFRSFSLATVGDEALNIFELFFTFLLFVGLALVARSVFMPPAPALFPLYRRRADDAPHSPTREKRIRWLAFHENSPASF